MRLSSHNAPPTRSTLRPSEDRPLPGRLKRSQGEWSLRDCSIAIRACACRLPFQPPPELRDTDPPQSIAGILKIFVCFSLNRRRCQLHEFGNRAVQPSHLVQHLAKAPLERGVHFGDAATYALNLPRKLLESLLRGLRHFAQSGIHRANVFSGKSLLRSDHLSCLFGDRQVDCLCRLLLPSFHIGDETLGTARYCWYVNRYQSSTLTCAGSILL